MPRLIHSTPKYRRHKASGQAIVTLNGRDQYLGPYGSKSSEAEYDRLVAEWLATRHHPAPTQPGSDITITELAATYWRFAKGYYRKNGRPTRTLEGIRSAIRVLRQMYGKTSAFDFGPRRLKTVQSQMVNLGLSRTYINGSIGRIRRVFRWAASEELLPISVYQALTTVSGLKRGRTEARETEPVEPVSDGDVDAVLPYLPPVVVDMVRFHRLVGCRPGEVCSIKPCDVDTTGDVWIYRPESHKTEHHGRERIICIGPRAQDVLRPYLLRDKAAYCFSPPESDQKRRAELHENRQTPLSCGNRPGSNRKRRPKRLPGERYKTNSYRQAIHRAIGRANEARDVHDKIPTWFPNQLRHSLGTKVRHQFGIEGAQVVLGHANADVTQVYAERDFELAKAIMEKIG